MRTAFLTEMGFTGKVPTNHPNMRTEFSWMAALQSDHFNIHNYREVKGYDAVFIIFPKATVKLNAVGVEMTTPGDDKDISIYSKPVVETLKLNNKLVCNVQEGPAWFFNEYDLVNQFNFYNQLSQCDILFTHNYHDTKFYSGLFPSNPNIYTIPSLVFADEFKTSTVTKTNKVIIGGNFCRWYNGFQSYLVASGFDLPIYVPSMHCKRKGEESVPNLNHLPYMDWKTWMNHLGQYKYAVHLMPTIAAGTFSLNCAIHGIPCIGNEKVDTQHELFPQLSIDPDDLLSANRLVEKLKDPSFYNEVSKYAKDEAFNSYYANVDKWKTHMESIISKDSSIELKSPKKVTAVFTSCGRFDLLEKTINSFVKFNDYPIEEYIVIDNSTNPDAKDNIGKILSNLKLVNSWVIINEENIGQVSSIDKAYSKVTTEYIFHCEDDWEFFDYDFIAKSIDVLEENPTFININIRVRMDGERGSMHPIGPAKETKNHTVYHEYDINYLGAWHGFSWNPGLRRLKDYNEIKPYKNYTEESGVGKMYYEMGKRSACLEKFYCKHIGQHSTTEKETCNMDKILITGGNGFLGRNLGLKLKDNYEVTLASRNNKNNFYAAGLTGCDCIPLDVSNIESVRDAIELVRPDIIVHAAATKFVDLSERFPMEAVDINIVGSQNIARVAIENKIKYVVGISTDKAAPPIRNIYGLTKATMEKMFCLMNDKSSTKFSCVRYGNVAWSTGSVFPAWKAMQKKDGIIKTTGSDMRRFFFTVEDAANLVITAIINKNEVAGKILSRAMKSALIGDVLDVWINKFGGKYEKVPARPGERLDEYLISESELPFSEQVSYHNEDHFLISPNGKSKNPLKKEYHTENAVRLTNNEIDYILSCEPDC